MRMTRKRIVILFHANERGLDLNRYVIKFFADIWREDGHDVRLLFGVKEFIPADLILVHVNLSVVPDEYLEFARRYPIALNGQVKDIRKSTFSAQLVTPDDDYDGMVIVKSDLNYAGRPERQLLQPWLSKKPLLASKIRSFRRRMSRFVPYFGDPMDYLLFDSIREVPNRYFRSEHVVVERFLPEIDDGKYFVRSYQFLGDRATTVRVSSDHPIVNSTTSTALQEIEVHHDVVEFRHAMKFDYGKFDYVLHNGRAVVLDINKTTGAGRSGLFQNLIPLRRHRAEGLYYYFDLPSRRE